MLGDSVMNGMAQGYSTAARALLAKKHTFILDTAGCRRLIGYSCHIGTRPAPTTALQELRANAGKFNKVIVVAAGYNDRTTGVEGVLSLQGSLFLGNSLPIREWNLAASEPEPGTMFFASRGANGIDGLISTAWGTALNNQNRTYLLIGDIAFLHDVGGLNIASTELQPNLTIVVSDNDCATIWLKQTAKQIK